MRWDGDGMGWDGVESGVDWNGMETEMGMEWAGSGLGSGMGWESGGQWGE